MIFRSLRQSCYGWPSQLHFQHNGRMSGCPKILNTLCICNIYGENTQKSTCCHGSGHSTARPSRYRSCRLHHTRCWPTRSLSVCGYNRRCHNHGRSCHCHHCGRSRAGPCELSTVRRATLTMHTQGPSQDWPMSCLAHHPGAVIQARKLI